MATFNYEVSPYRKADGTRLVKVRINHRRKTLRKPLGIYASDSQLTRDKTRIKDAALAEAVNAAVDRLRMAAAEVEGSEWMEVSELWRCISARMEAKRGFCCDFFSFGYQITASMEKGTRDGYIYALRAFSKFLGRERCEVNEIDRRMVTDFRSWIEKKNGKGCRAASAYLEKLRYIHNRARERYNDDEVGLVRIHRQPFVGMIPPQPSTDHRALTLRQLRAVLGATPATKRGRMALDVFRLSFALVGINTADIYKLPKGALRGGLLDYNRSKTDSRRADKAEMLVRVEPEAAEVLERWKGSRMLLSFFDMYSDFRGFNKAVNAGLKEVGRLAGVNGLTTYHARHTWATLARNECGVPRDVVSEALNHASRGSDRVTDIYIERDFSRVWEANRRVLDLVKNNKAE